MQSDLELSNKCEIIHNMEAKGINSSPPRDAYRICIGELGQH